MHCADAVLASASGGLFSCGSCSILFFVESQCVSNLWCFHEKKLRKQTAGSLTSFWKAPVKSPLLGIDLLSVGIHLSSYSSRMLSCPSQNAPFSRSSLTFLRRTVYETFMDSSPLWETSFEASVVLHSVGSSWSLFPWLEDRRKGIQAFLPLNEHSTNSCTRVLRAASFAHTQGICLSHFLFLAFLRTALPHECSYIILPVAIVDAKWASLWSPYRRHTEVNPTKS